MLELTLEGVTKKYGDKKAVSGVSCTLGQGVYGLLGANGSGKTTLLRKPQRAASAMAAAGLGSWGRSTGGFWAICPRISGIIRSSRRSVSCCIWRR